MLVENGHGKPPVHGESSHLEVPFQHSSVCRREGSSFQNSSFILCRYIMKDHIYRCIELLSFKDFGPLKET